MTGIREYFAELSGDEPDWFQMVFYFEQEHAARLERNRDWLKRNRIWRSVKRREQRASNESIRSYHREYARKWRAENAEHAKAAQREQKRKWRAKNGDKQRAYMKQWRAARKAQANGTPSI